MLDNGRALENSSPRTLPVVLKYLSSIHGCCEVSQLCMNGFEGQRILILILYSASRIYIPVYPNIVVVSLLFGMSMIRGESSQSSIGLHELTSPAS